MDNLIRLWEGSGIYNMSLGQGFMIVIGLLLLFLAIKKKFEPLLLVPIGFGAVLSNIPMAGLSESASFQAFYKAMTYETAVVEQYLSSEGSGLKRSGLKRSDSKVDDSISFTALPADVQNSKNPKTAELTRKIRAVLGDALEQCDKGMLCKEAYNFVKENDAEKAFELSEIARKNS